MSGAFAANISVDAASGSFPPRSRPTRASTAPAIVWVMLSMTKRLLSRGPIQSGQLLPGSLEREAHRDARSWIAGDEVVAAYLVFIHHDCFRTDAQREGEISLDTHQPLVLDQDPQAGAAR